MEKYQNKYRIPSARLAGFDYAKKGAYFITICTKNRKHYFGEIVDSLLELRKIPPFPPTTQTTIHPVMQLNKIGRIVENEWMKTPAIRPDMNLELAEFVIMPNHFHAIIIIGDNKYNTIHTRDRGAMHCASTKNQFGPQSKNLASIVRGFKSSVTKFARKSHIDFAWQSRFHDHIIRNTTSFENIRNYIVNNPLNWQKDKFHV